jgi:hypothetical protein
VHDRARGTNVFIDAPGNFHAALVGARVLVNGLGLGALGDADARVYGFDDLQTPTPVIVTGLGAGQASGFVVPLSAGGALLGAFDLEAFTNRFFGVTGAGVEGAFADPAVAPTLSPEVFAVPAMLAAAPLADGVAVVAADENFAPRAVQFAAVPSDGATFNPTTLADVLTTTGSCTRIGVLASPGDGSLFVVLDHASSDDAIVRLDVPTPPPGG